MTYNQKFLAKCAVKSWAFVVIAGFFTLTSMTQRRTTGFAGEWKLNESKTVSGNFLCIYDAADRMWSKTMKISEDADFLVIDVANSFSDGVYTSREKLSFSGKESEVNFGSMPSTVGSKRKKFSVSRTNDGQTITVNSVVYMDLSGNKSEFYVIEVWRLSDAGNSISAEYHVKSTFLGGERFEKRVYDKVN